MQKRSAHSRKKVGVDLIDRPVLDEMTPVQAMKAIGSVVYAIRFDDGSVKIGWTSDLAQRKRTWRIRGNDGILAVMPGSVEDEQAIHERLIPHRHHGVEYYHQTPEVLAEVNALRGSVGMPPLDSLS